MIAIELDDEGRARLERIRSARLAEGSAELVGESEPVWTESETEAVDERLFAALLGRYELKRRRDAR